MKAIRSRNKYEVKLRGCFMVIINGRIPLVLFMHQTRLTGETTSSEIALSSRTLGDIFSNATHPMGRYGLSSSILRYSDTRPAVWTRHMAASTFACHKKKISWQLRNRKHVPCFYQVIETRVQVWENEKCCGNTSRRRVFPQLFRVLPNFHECFYWKIRLWTRDFYHA